MSDFLTSLIGRARGTLEVVQPRVPSIYEPYRRGVETQPGIGPRVATSEASVENDPGDGTNAAPISHQTQELGARRVLPRRNAQTEPAVETGSEGDASATSINHRTHGLRTQVVATTPEVPFAGHEPDAQAADPSRVVRPSLVSRVIARPEQIAAIEVLAAGHGRTKELIASSITRHTFQPSLQTTKATDPMAVPSADTREDRSESAPPLPAAQAVTTRGVFGSLRSLEIETETSSTSLGFRRSAEPRVSAEPSLVAQPLSSATAAAGSLEWPSLQVHPVSSVTGGVRPPLAPRSGGARNPEALSPSNPPKPDIQVSIGRVEVRAVFPEPATRRRPPQTRSRPTVSLDDYLNRRHREQR